LTELSSRVKVSTTYLGFITLHFDVAGVDVVGSCELLKG